MRQDRLFQGACYKARAGKLGLPDGSVPRDMSPGMGYGVHGMESAANGGA